MIWKRRPIRAEEYYVTRFQRIILSVAIKLDDWYSCM